MRFFYTAGVILMIAAFPSWFVAVVADDTTAGAVGMLIFLLGVLVTAVGAAMDYRGTIHEEVRMAWAEVDETTHYAEGQDPRQEWPRP